MNAELKDLIAGCEVCQKHAHSQQRETLSPHPEPSYPWERVGCDIFEFKAKNFLITVDYYSNFWEVDQLKSMTSNQVILKLKSHFARHGIPRILISDNGPQFTSEEFDNFCKSWNFKHKTSSPGYPRSNGMAESAVKTAKMLLKKADDNHSDPQMAFLDYRNTPLQELNASPAQLLMGRRTRTTLPAASVLLQPKTIDVSEKRKARKQKTTFYYNRQAKELPRLVKVKASQFDH